MAVSKRFGQVPRLNGETLCFYSRRDQGKPNCPLRTIWHQILLDIWHNGELLEERHGRTRHPCRNRRRSRFQDLRSVAGQVDHRTPSSSCRVTYFDIRRWKAPGEKNLLTAMTTDEV